MIAAFAISAYGTSMVSAMMKATAPITGGMICPPIDEVASTPPAKAEVKPKRFISGMVNWPEATTLATPEPETVPISARGRHAHLARSAARAAERRHRDLVEEADDARLLHEGAEQDEQEDVGRRHQRRRAVDALGAEHHMLDHLRHVIAAMIERRRQVIAEQAVGQEDPRP